MNNGGLLFELKIFIKTSTVRPAKAGIAFSLKSIGLAFDFTCGQHK